MDISPKTKIDDLLSTYPFLLEFFLARSPKYKLLKNPVSRKTLGKVASLAQVASIGELDLDQMLLDIAAEIREKTGDEAASAGAPEDRAARQEILKGIIRDLHAGEDMEILKQRFHDLIRDVDASEIAAMEQGLIAEGMPESEIKRLCDVHVGVFQESLEAQPAPRVPPGHPVYTFTLENRAVEEITREITELIERAGSMAEDEFLRQNQAELENLLARLSDIDLHYLRKENQLFPILEQHEITGPSQVMWALHDDIRDALRTAREELAASKGRESLNTIRYLVKSIDDMVYKEENILFPMALETLSDSEWQQVAQGEGEIGFAWISPEDAGVQEAGAGSALPGSARVPDLLDLSTGQLTPRQVDLLLTHLPVEVSYVDENDEVRFYSKVEHKIFPRSPGVIGRRVQNCHPPASLDKVQRILDEFKAGTKDAADFWIEKKGRFIYIRYFAVRDDSGTYKGTLEVVQDVTGIRALSGQQRLLDWE
ncbi:MAG: DUF438 domain-containing protein [Actinobacteria bacterium]|nr:DUF438 domain-containing protein [Actinomycetota bacterium]